MVKPDCACGKLAAYKCAECDLPLCSMHVYEGPWWQHFCYDCLYGKEESDGKTQEQ